MSKTQPLDEFLKELEGTSPSKRDKILEERGRSCIGKSFLKKAQEAAKGTKNDEEIIDNLVDSIQMLSREGNILYMIYPKCYCHHVKKYKGEIPEYYCDCSAGWIKELFKNALGREVDVKIESTILRGGSECRFRIKT
ncbi:hypothetical protein JW766_04470 [Candidatus Dojkabacteria bacterium]|nr:hypothetical protein [Candidatus Dojkabacteria bacterium]